MVGYIYLLKIICKSSILIVERLHLLSKRVFMPNILKKKEGNEMRLSKSCCMFMAVIVVLTGCANPVLDDPKDETEISNEIILSNNTLPEETYSIEIITYHYKILT